jgi:hypothetical protein
MSFWIHSDGEASAGKYVTRNKVRVLKYPMQIDDSATI